MLSDMELDKMKWPQSVVMGESGKALVAQAREALRLRERLDLAWHELVRLRDLVGEVDCDLIDAVLEHIDKEG